MYDIIIGRSEDDRPKFGSRGLVYLGKHYVKMGRSTSLANKIYLDVARSHVVFVCGKRGGGKCLTGDTLITLENGFEVPIEQLECDNNNVFGLNHKLKVGSFKKSDFFKREVDELLKIKFRSGKEIKLTREHPLLTIEGWVPADKLSLGQKIATPRKIPCFGKEEMENGKIKLLAYLIAEGHTKKSILFCNSDKEIVEDFRDSLGSVQDDLELTEFSKYSYKLSSKRFKNVVLGHNIIRDKYGKISKGTSISHRKTVLREFLEEHGLYGFLSREKKIPTRIFMLNEPSLALFLNRLFSGDGSIFRHSKGSNWEISYASSSRVLITQVQSLLLRFGILSKTREKKTRCNGKIFDNYELEINGENVTSFVNQIGFFGEKKEKQEIALKDMNELKRNPNIDVIPKEIWNHYRPKSWVAAGKSLNYASPKALRSSISYGSSRQKLLQIAIADSSEEIRLIAESDIFWDEIIAMEKLEGIFTVYDISVPEVHNFIANNIIVHNSYTLGVIAEGMADLDPETKENVSVVILDTMGIYWTMRYENKKDEALLREWDLKTKTLDVKIFTPVGYFKEYREKGIPTDVSFSILPSELSAGDWCLTFEVNANDPIGVLIERVINKLKKTKPNYTIPDVIREIQADTRSEPQVRAAVENRFANSDTWGVFSDRGTPMRELISPGQVAVLDLSCYATMSDGWKIKALVIGLVSQKLFIERMLARKYEELKDITRSTSYFDEEKEGQQRTPLVWLLIDEAHEFLPNDGKTTATDPLITILREGRQPGISLILASQQPGKIHTDVMTQADTVISHRITAKVDTDALGALMQSYMRDSLPMQLETLPSVKGAAVIFDDTNEKIYPMRIRPRFTWHGGEAPAAVVPEKKEFDF